MSLRVLWRRQSIVVSDPLSPRLHPPTSGHVSRSWDYAISLPDMKIISTTASKQYIGHAPWFLTNVATLVDGGSIQMSWWAPTSNFKNSTLTDMPYNVTTQPITVQSVSLTAWNVSRTGQQTGDFHDDNGVYSRGPETDSYIYDPLYGTVITVSYRQTANYPGELGSGWNEVYLWSETLVDSTLSFQSG